MKNLGLKLVSLLVAILIWLQITLTTNHQTPVMLELKVISSLPSDSTYTGKHKVPYIVQGRGIDIIKLRHSKAFIQVSAEGIRSGSDDNFELKNFPDNLNLKFVGIDPTAIPDLQKRWLDIEEKPDTPTKVDTSSEMRTYVVNIPLQSFSGAEYFPASITVKVRSETNRAQALAKDILISVAETPDAGGLYSVSLKSSSGIKVLDFNPKQVRRIN